MTKVSKIKIGSDVHNINDTGAVHSSSITNIVRLTESEYTALLSKDDSVFYIVDPDPVLAPTFGGLEISSGNVYYDGSSWSIDSAWNTHCTYNNAYGVNSSVPSNYFNFIEMGTIFDKAGFSTSDGSINNNLDPFNGWRLPTVDEWSIIVGSNRSGSTINGNSNKHYALIQLTDISYSGSETPFGLLLFPDGQTIIGKELSGMDNTTVTNSVTVEELNVYLSSNCVFLPGGGFFNSEIMGGRWLGGASSGYYMSSTENTNTSSQDGYLKFNNAGATVGCVTNGSKTTEYRNVRLVRTAQ